MIKSPFLGFNRFGVGNNLKNEDFALKTKNMSKI